jgi:hypothetical protein
VRHVVKTGPRRGDVPVDERDRAQALAAILVDRVPGGQVVVAHHFLIAGQRRSGRQIVELPDQPGHLGQALG